MSTSSDLFVHNEGILAGMDATAIATHIRNKGFTVEEVVACVQQRAEKVNPTLNAIVTADYQLNLSNYKPDGFFAGVPMYIKDASKITGFPTGHGTRAFTPKVEKKNDPYMNDVEKLGFVFVGKSTLSEFGLLPSTESLRTGTTLNPIHLEYSTGGSSGGAASLVASGVIPMAHGRDGGGSIRIPAACCGLVGLKI